MKFALDSNILFYALDRDDPGKRAIARDILRRGRDTGMVISAQVLGEFVNAIRRKRTDNVHDALGLVDQLSAVVPVHPTTTSHIAAAGRLALRHHLQFWDSVIIEVARAESIGVLLSEDMQDGATIDGVTILDPFNPANAASLDRLLTA